MTKARTLADMISDGVIGTTELADDVITPVKLDETGSYVMDQLGINVSSPSVKLDVSTSLISSGSDYGTSAIRVRLPFTTGYQGQIGSAVSLYDGAIHGADIGYKYLSGGYHLSFSTNSTTSGSPTERVVIDKSGNALLKTGGAALQWNNGYQTITGDPFANDLTYRTYHNHIFKNITGASSTTDGTEVFRIDNDGQIGINQPNPLALLDIKGDTTTYGGMAKIYLTDDSGHIDSRNWSIGNGGSAYGSLTIGLSNNQGGDPQAAGTHTNPLVITKDSLVGINSPNPVGTLDIVNSGQTFAHIRSTTVNAAALRIQASDTGTGNGDGLYIGRSAAVNYLWTYENEPLVFATGNLERMRINEDGHVTKLYQPSFSGRGLVPVNINSYAQLNVNLGPNTVSHNTGNHFNTSTNQFTCPVAGKYWVYSSLLIDDDSGTSELIRYYWYKNGIEFTRAYDNVRAVSTGGRYEGMVSCGAVVDCAANDILYMRADSGALHTGFESNFSIYFLG